MSMQSSGHGWSAVEHLLDAGDDAAALREFEARLPFQGLFGCAHLLPRLAAIYAGSGRTDAAMLLAGFAGPADDASSDPQVLAILADPGPEAALLRAMEQLDSAAGQPAAARLFEQVSRRLPPISEYWIYFRAARIYAALQRADACFLVAAVTLWMDPRSPTAWSPAHDVFTWFQSQGRFVAAARVLRHWSAHFPGQPLADADTTAAVEAAAGPASAAAEGRPEERIDRRIVPAEQRRPQPWFCYGPGPPRALRELSRVLERRAIWVTEVADAELLISDDAVVALSAGGAVLTDLCVGALPELVRRRLDARGEVERLELDVAVLVGDSFPSPNLCHFMLDQATRLTLYRKAGVAVETATVIGPELATPYQQAIAARFGAVAWLGTNRHARVRVRRLHVSSSCRALQHTAHWGSEWALGAVRAAFGVDGTVPPRGRRLLVSRADARYRRLANEPDVAALLAQHGFELIQPGRMGLDDQVAAFAAASHVVAVHGAALANLVFCPPGAHVLEIFPVGQGTWSYAIFTPTLRLDYATMVSPEAGGDVTVDLDELRRWVGDVEA